MSPEADVAFMESACQRIAKARAKGPGMQQKIDAIISALRTREWEPTGNRVYEWLKRRARMVHGFEKDRARAVVEAIEAEDERKKNAEHLLWLESQIEGLQQGTSDPDIRGPHVDALQCVLRGLRGDGSAVAVHDAAERAGLDQETQE